MERFGVHASKEFDPGAPRLGGGVTAFLFEDVASADD